MPLALRAAENFGRISFFQSGFQCVLGDKAAFNKNFLNFPTDQIDFFFCWKPLPKCFGGECRPASHLGCGHSSSFAFLSGVISSSFSCNFQVLQVDLVALLGLSCNSPEHPQCGFHMYLFWPLTWSHTDAAELRQLGPEERLLNGARLVHARNCELAAIAVLF